MSSRRARKPATFYIKGLLKESEPGVYKLEENGITYELTYEQFNLLKVENSTIEEWYNKLDRFAKKAIVRNGNIQTEDYGFYPDI
jgi:hypothetical protein